MIGIFTAYPQNDLGLTVLKTGRGVFLRGTRVAVMSLNAAQEHLKAGILPAVNQLEALNPHFQGLYDNETVFRLCGGSTELDHYVLWLSKCQWLGCDAKHYVPYPVGNNGSICICRSCEHKLNTQVIPDKLVDISRQNRIAFILNHICEQMGQPADRQLSQADIFVWCLRNNLQSHLPSALLHNLLGYEPNESTGKECDNAPSYAPLELLEKRLSEVVHG